MRPNVQDAARGQDIPIAVGAPAPAERPLRSWVSRGAWATLLGACLVVATCSQASAFRLKLVFPDGQPMTYGSACNGHGCLNRGNLETTDARGEIVLSDRDRTIEYRREGIALAEVEPGLASGRFVAVADRATIVLPHLLLGSAPAVDAAEADLFARLNAERARDGLPAARLNPRLSAAADLQATWLMQSGVLVEQPDEFHTGPFRTTFGFRLAEVSMPDAQSGSEIVEAGGTPEQALDDWMSSGPHRQIVLARGAQLMGVGQAGSFIVVNTHPPCAGCDAPMPAPAPAPTAAAPPPPPAAANASTQGSSGAARPLPACGRETLRVRRLRNIGGRVRLSVRTGCLRPGARYAVIVRQGRTGRQLALRVVKHAGTLTLRVRPSRGTRLLRIRLKRDGRAILANSLTLRR